MPIKTVYVKAKSKKAINEALEAGEKVICTHYGFLGGGMDSDIKHLNDGDVIKVYEKEINGSPYAKSYGNWDAKKGRVK